MAEQSAPAHPRSVGFSPFACSRERQRVDIRRLARARRYAAFFPDPRSLIPDQP